MPADRETRPMNHKNLIRAAAVLLACVALAFAGPRGQEMLVRGHAGPSFVFTPTSNPLVFKAAVKGVAYISALGNCLDQAELEVCFPATPGQPVLVSGAGTFTSSDGANALNFTLRGSAIPDPVVGAFFNSKYCLTFTGGAGDWTAATGSAEIEEVILLSSATTGSASWVMEGRVRKRR